MSSYVKKGSCLCQTVKYRITGHLGVFQYCHCSRCRKFTGSAFAASIFVRPNDFEWLEGEEAVGRFEVPEAEYYATQFCKHCGSSLPWLSQAGKTVIVPAGTLDEDPQIRPQQNIYCLSDAQWYEQPGELPSYDELPPRK